MKRWVLTLAATLAALLVGAGPGHAREPEKPSAPASRERLDAVQLLLSSSPEPLIRESAAQVLGQRGDPGAVPLLIRHLASDEDPWVRARSAEALGLLGDRRATRPLRSALAREKNQRVRRTVAEALVRLGQVAGTDELLWQVRAGTNHSKAEAARFLVQVTGQPLGQDAEAFRAHLRDGGLLALGLRPPGSPGLLPLSSASEHDSAASDGPRLRGPAFGWRVLPAVVLDLRRHRGDLTAADLVILDKQAGPLPDGCLLLLRVRREPQGLTAPSATSPPSVRLTADAVQHLLATLPNLLGLGLDAEPLDAPLPASKDSGPSHGPLGSQLLLKQGKLLITGLDHLGRLPSTGVRVLLVSGVAEKGRADRPVLPLALLP